MMKVFLSILVILALSGAAYFIIMREEPTSTRTTPIKIVAFGDSLTYGYGVEEENNYPNQLKRALSAYQIDMVNLGANGDTTTDSKARVQSVADEKPDIVLLGIGGNDALRLIPVAEAKANIESIIKSLLAVPNPPRIVLLQMQAGIHGGFAYKNEFDAIYGDLAEAYNISLAPFIVTKVYLDQNYMLSDRIHMNERGYAFVVNEFLKGAVEKEIRKLN